MVAYRWLAGVIYKAVIWKVLEIDGRRIDT